MSFALGKEVRCSTIKLEGVETEVNKFGNAGDLLTSDGNGNCEWLPGTGGAGVQNPMNADLDLGGFSIVAPGGGSVEGDSMVPNQLPADTLPPNPSSLFKPQIVQGFPSYIGAGQDPFNTTGTNFPTSSTGLLWGNGMPINAMNSIIGRRTGVVFPPGLYGNQIGFGNKLTFTDRVVYDPNGLRHAPVAPAFFTAAIVKPYTPIGVLEVHTHLEGEFLAPGDNSVSGSIEHFRAGALLRSYKLFREYRSANQLEVVSSASRYLMGFAPYNEDYQVGDYFEIHMGNDPASVADFQLDLFKAVLTFHPAP